LKTITTALLPASATTLMTTLTLVCLIFISGCSSLIASQTGKLADNISQAMLNNDDPETVAQAMPTFLVLIDAFASDRPGTGILLSAAKLNSAYASTFLDEGERQQRLSKKGFSFAKQAACQYRADFCQITSLSFEAMEALSPDLAQDDVPVIFTLASSWLTFIQAHSDDWQVIADMPKVKLLLEQVIALDEGYDYGSTHIYLGGIATLLPPSLGGKPEIGKAHFERAISLSNGKLLLAKVEYARRYARLVFDEELHHQLLTEVLASDIHVDGLTLMNALAHQEAKKLLADEADYF
jgi:hypothetical protein